MKHRWNGHRNQEKRGFTLVEIIVVLLVLAVVSAISVPAVLGFIDDGQEKECQAHREALAENIVAAQMAYEVTGDDEAGGSEEKEPFNVQTYIDQSSLQCPTDGDYTYTKVIDKNGKECDGIHCSKHGDTCLPNAGSYDLSYNIQDNSAEEVPHVKPTPTQEEKESETPTPTQEEKESETPTPTPEETPSETPTPTPGETPTETPTPTPTPGETPTETPTPTPEETPAETPTPTPEEKTDGIFDPNHFTVYADDEAGILLNNYPNEKLRELFRNLPPGTWYWERDGESDNRSVDISQQKEVKLFAGSSTEPFTLKYVADDGRVDFLTVDVGFPVKSVQLHGYSGDMNGELGVGATLTYSAVLNPSYTTDAPIQWRIETVPADMPVEITYGNASRTKAYFKPLAPGEFKVQPYAFEQRSLEEQGIKKEVSASSWSRDFTVKYLDVTDVKIPSEIRVRTGEKADINVRILPETGYDPSSVTYSYDISANEYFSVADGKVEGLKSTAQLQGHGSPLAVTVSWNGRSWTGTCMVKVVGQDEPVVEAPALNLMSGESAVIVCALSPEMENVTFRYENMSTDKLDLDPDTGVVTARESATTGTAEPAMVRIEAWSGDTWLAEGTCYVNIRPDKISSSNGKTLSFTAWNTLKGKIQNGQINGTGGWSSDVYYSAADDGYYLVREGAVLTWKEEYPDDITFEEYLQMSGAGGQFLKMNINWYNIYEIQPGWPLDGNEGDVRQRDGEYYICIKAYTGDNGNWTEEQILEHYLKIPMV